jgi:hypothetical protein
MNGSAAKRYEVQGVDTFEATSAPGESATYHLAWFDELEDALRYARASSREPHDASESLCDQVRVFDHVERRIVFSKARPSSLTRL